MKMKRKYASDRRVWWFSTAATHLLVRLSWTSRSPGSLDQNVVKAGSKTPRTVGSYFGPMSDNVILDMRSFDIRY